MIRVVFICDGNKCRSPMAEAMLKQVLEGRRLDGVEVSSCGLTALQRGEMNSELRSVIQDEVSHLSGFRSRLADSRIVGEADLVLTMETRHVEAILAKFPEAMQKTFTVAGFVGRHDEIKDFDGSADSSVVDWLKKCHAALDELLPEVAEKLAVMAARPNSSVDPKKLHNLANRLRNHS